MDLQNWIEQGRAHWKEHLPKRYAELKAAGKLESSLREAANQTYLEASQLEEAGFQPDEAWQMVRESYLILPAEGQQQKPAETSLTHRMAAAARSGQREMKIG